MDGTPAPEGVRKACSAQSSGDRAVAEIHAAIGGSDNSCVVFFCSADHDLPSVGAAMAKHFGDTLVVGCSTAGEITPEGYGRRSLTAIALPRRTFAAVALPIDNVSTFDLTESPALVSEARARLARLAPFPTDGNCFAFLLIDGLSRREEWVVSALSLVLDDIQLFGGSAGDQLRFNRTHIYLAGPSAPMRRCCCWSPRCARSRSSGRNTSSAPTARWS